MKGGLQEPPLAAVLIVRAGGQAVAHHLAPLVEEPAALVERAVVQQQLPHQARITDHPRPHRPQPHLHHVPLHGERPQKPQRIPAQHPQMPQHGKPAQGARGNRPAPHIHRLPTVRPAFPCHHTVSSLATTTGCRRRPAAVPL